MHGDWLLALGTQYSYRGPYFIGVGGEGIRWSDKEEIWPSSYFLDLEATLSFEPSSQFEVLLAGGKQVLGTDTRWFSTLGLEEFSPQPGWVGSLEGVVRW